jgi:hypothetical protein
MPMDANELFANLGAFPNGYVGLVSSTGGAFRATFSTPKEGQRRPVFGMSSSAVSIEDAIEKALASLAVQLNP